LSDNPLAAGLAMAAGTPRRARQSGGPARTTAATRWSFSTPAAPVLYEDGEAGARRSARHDWFAPLRRLGGRSTPQPIAPTIYGQLRWTLRQDRWKFWRQAARRSPKLAKERPVTRIVTRSSPPRVVWQLEQQGLHPLLARLYAARGITDKAELDYELKSLLPPAALTHATDAAQCWPTPSRPKPSC
jgi:hypothetical protein